MKDKTRPDLVPPRQFAGWNEYLEAVAGTPLWWELDHPDFKPSSKGHVDEEDWDLRTGMNGAIQLAQDGWSEGLEKIAELAITAREERRDLAVRRFVVEQAGSRPLVPLYCAGSPIHMQRAAPRMHKRPIMDLVVDGCFHCNISAQECYAWGVAVLSLIDTLSHQGLSVALHLGITIHSNHGDPSMVRWEVPIKSAGQPLDMDRLAFMIAHPANFRRLGFRYLEGVREAYGDYCSGYGRPRDAKAGGHLPIAGDSISIPGVVAATDIMKCTDTPAQAIDALAAWWAEHQEAGFPVPAREEVEA